MSLSNIIDNDTVKVSLKGARSREVVVFNVSPELSVSRAISYKAMEPVHLPGQIYAYEKTMNRTFSLNAKIISRTRVEASLNLNRLNQIQSWGMSHFGKQNDIRTYGPLGAPPEVLYLTAYSKADAQQNIYRIPTVLTNISYSYPNDVDYIEAGDLEEITGNIDVNGTPWPIIMSIELNLLEVHSPKDFSKFSLSKYKQGKLTNF